MNENYMNITILTQLGKNVNHTPLHMASMCAKKIDTKQGGDESNWEKSEYKDCHIQINYENLLKLHKIDLYNCALKKLIAEDVMRRLYGITQAGK